MSGTAVNRELLADVERLCPGMQIASAYCGFNAFRGFNWLRVSTRDPEMHAFVRRRIDVDVTGRADERLSMVREAARQLRKALTRFR
jgi:hypothetical protein